MISSEKAKCVLIAWCLVFCGIGWALSFLFLFWNWDAAFLALEMMGARKLVYDPFLHYWMRLIATIFGSFGVFCSVSACRQEKFQAIIPWIGWMHLFTGIVAAVASFGTGMGFSEYPTLLAELAFFWTIGLTLVIVPHR